MTALTGLLVTTSIKLTNLSLSFYFLLLVPPSLDHIAVVIKNFVEILLRGNVCQHARGEACSTLKDIKANVTAAFFQLADSK